MPEYLTIDPFHFGWRRLQSMLLLVMQANHHIELIHLLLLAIVICQFKCLFLLRLLFKHHIKFTYQFYLIAFQFILIEQIYFISNHSQLYHIRFKNQTFDFSNLLIKILTFLIE